MGGEWAATTLGQVLELKRGYDLPTSQRQMGTVPIVSSGGVSGSHATAMVRGPGVVTGRYGTIGEVFYVETDFWPLNTTLYVRDFKGANPRFVSYFLKQFDFQAYADKAAVPGINRNDLHRAEIHWPPRIEQDAIAKVLSALDDRINVNQRIANTLEEMARELFKSWFVDFDPVRAKAGGVSTGLLDNLATLFPDSFGEEGLPIGWQLHRLGEEIELRYGKPLTAENRNPGTVPVYGSNGQVGVHDSPLVNGPGIVVGRKGNPGVVTYVPTSFFPIDTTFYVVPRRNAPISYLWFLLESAGLVARAADSAVPGLNREAAYAAEVVVAPLKLTTEFDRIASQLIARADAARNGNRALADLRDTLLPRLVSGELRIADAEAQVSAA